MFVESTAHLSVAGPAINSETIRNADKPCDRTGQVCWPSGAYKQGFTERRERYIWRAGNVSAELSPASCASGFSAPLLTRFLSSFSLFPVSTLTRLTIKTARLPEPPLASGARFPAFPPPLAHAARTSPRISGRAKSGVATFSPARPRPRSLNCSPPLCNRLIGRPAGRTTGRGMRRRAREAR